LLTQPNSSQVQQIGSTLQEVSRAARSLRVLADYLERHPDALLRGKPGEAK
jgi:paraquat-inducible protein B